MTAFDTAAMMAPMMWRTLLAAALLLPPLAYVAGTLYAEEPAPDERPALVLDEDDRGPADSERQVTIRPERDATPGPDGPPARPRDDDGDGDDGDDDDDGDDRDDDGPVVIRPIPDEVDDDDDDDDDDDGGERDRDD